MSSKCLLHRNAPLDVFLDPIVGLDQGGQQVENGIDLVVWDGDDAFRPIAEHHVSLRSAQPGSPMLEHPSTHRSDDQVPEGQRGLDGMYL